MSAAIELDGARVTFPGFSLGPLSFRVAPGERVALVGANGAGKSTTLRCVAGRLVEYEGSIRVCGDEAKADPATTKARVGVLPERLLGFGWMTVREHLELLSAFYPTWDGTYALALADQLDVPVDKALGHLSKGNRVKLALVAAEAFRPPVLLLDEPTSGIDPVMRDRLMTLVAQAFPGGGERILLFSTHLLEDVEGVAERVLLMRDGRLLGDDRVDRLRAESGGDPLHVALRRRLADA